MNHRFRALAAWILASTLMVGAALAQTADRQRAPGFTQLPANASVAVFPVDVELFELSAGGIPEPRADWTAGARKHMGEAFAAIAAKAGIGSRTVSDDVADEFAEQVGLHAAVARAIALHHTGPVVWRLPSKAEQLNWSFADAMQPVAAKTGARYGLFMWVRDSYASAGRKAMMVGMAILGVAMTGGIQVGYASLVDLQTGQVLWFNQLARGSGDLREAAAAAETMDALLRGLPVPVPVAAEAAPAK